MWGGGKGARCGSVVDMGVAMVTRSEEWEEGRRSGRGEDGMTSYPAQI